MADTGWVRFSTVDSSDWTNTNNLIGTNTGDCTTTASPDQFTLSGLTLSIPDGYTINGIEYQFNAKYSSGGISRSFKSKLILGSDLGTEHLQASSTVFNTYNLYSYGSSTTTEGLTGITTSNVENLKLKVETVLIIGATLHIEGTTIDPSPAIKVYYSEPTPPPSATGENSLSLTSGQLSLTSGQLFIR